MFPKLPDDIMSRSKSTQMQWVILIFLWVSASIFLIVSGISYIMNILGIAYFTLQDTLIIFSLALTLVIFNIIKNTKKHFREAIKQQSVPDLNPIFDDLLAKMQEVVDDTNEDGSRRKVVVIEYLKKSIPIIVEIKPSPEMSEQDIEKAFGEILDQHFKGLVISAEVKLKKEEEKKEE